MKFFLPGAKDPKLAEETYLQIKANADRDHVWKTSSDRIFAIQHVHNGKPIYEEVGQPSPSNGEMVIAIFGTGGGPFLVCTTHRGVVSGSAMLTSDDASVTLFYGD